MALTMKRASLTIAAMGLISFAFGVAAEIYKPPIGIAVPVKDVVVCKYPSDLSVYLGSVSIIFLIGSIVMGYRSLFYPYDGKFVPYSALFKSNMSFVFFNIAVFTSGIGLALLLNPTITEQMYKIQNVHHGLETECPTAKTGVFGGGAFLSLDSTLLWMLTLMFVNNAREDYFEELEEKNDSQHEERLMVSS